MVVVFFEKGRFHGVPFFFVSSLTNRKTSSNSKLFPKKNLKWESLKSLTVVSDFKLENGIYNACKTKKITSVTETVEVPNFSNCNSKHFKAMAEINLYTYNYFDLRGEEELSKRYLEDWIKYEDMAQAAVYDELNIKCNKSWKNVKNNSKKMWNLIDWKGKDQLNKTD